MKKEYADFLIREQKNNYNKIANLFSEKREKTWQDIISFLSNYIKENDRILDSGCGNGRFYPFFKKNKTDYFGIDFSENLIKIAKKKYPDGKFLVANSFNLPFSDNFFDKVISIAVFHHIPSKVYRLKFLAEIKRVLKNNGLLILSVWNLQKNKKAKKLFLKYTILKLLGLTKLDFKDIFYPWKDKSGKILINRYFHIFSEKEIKKILEKSGFLVEKVKKNDNIVLAARISKNF